MIVVVVFYKDKIFEIHRTQRKAKKRIEHASTHNLKNREYFRIELHDVELE